MNYCPNCGKKLFDNIIDNTKVKSCSCGFVDWNNYCFVVAVSLSFKDNKLLMVRLKGKEDNKMTFPGGYRNLGETIEEACKREAFEESGYIIDNLKLYKTYTKDEQRLVWIVFTADVIEGYFKENSETKEVIFIDDKTNEEDINFRGQMTYKWYKDIMKDHYSKK